MPYVHYQMTGLQGAANLFWAVAYALLCVHTMRAGLNTMDTVSARLLACPSRI
jgi:hypothetical protein